VIRRLLKYLLESALVWLYAPEREALEQTVAEGLTEGAKEAVVLLDGTANGGTMANGDVMDITIWNVVLDLDEGDE
jgi:hypothetical protein